MIDSVLQHEISQRPDGACIIAVREKIHDRLFLCLCLFDVVIARQIRRYLRVNIFAERFDLLTLIRHIAPVENHAADACVAA